MMTPIGLAVILQTRSLIEGSDADIPTAQGEFNFGTGLMLCIAYSASIGGVATIIGTPPNLILVGAISETFGREISFAQWMLYGVPIAVVGIAIVWGYVVKAFIPPRMDSIPGGLDVIDEELQSLGPMSREEKLVFVVFVAAALAWISRSLVDPFAAIVTDDSIIAIGAALILFLLPSRQGDGSLAFLLDWDTAVEIPWGVLLLFGGGLTIANGFEETGLAEWIGGLLSAFQGVSIALVIGVIVVLTIFLTEVTSNTATTAMLMPILASLAVGLSIHPYAVMIGAATAASFAFMLPVATPPNAIVFGSGYITIPQMAKNRGRAQSHRDRPDYPANPLVAAPDLGDRRHSIATVGRAARGVLNPSENPVEVVRYRGRLLPSGDDGATGGRQAELGPPSGGGRMKWAAIGGSSASCCSGGSPRAAVITPSSRRRPSSGRPSRCREWPSGRSSRYSPLGTSSFWCPSARSLTLGASDRRCSLASPCSRSARVRSP
jgi:hypothetical protein